MRFFFCYCIEKDYLCKNFQAKILKTCAFYPMRVRIFVGYFIVTQYVKLIIITMKKFLLSIFCCLMAVFAVQAQSYVKVTSAPADWSGEYLIVYEAGNVAFNGGLTTLDAVSNTIPVTIVDNAIEATDVVNAAKFTINASGNILSASGYYIGRTANSNGLLSSTSTKYTNTISLNSDGSAHIVGSGNAVLRYNATSGQYRFRYYKSSSYASQKAIALYKYTEGGGGETPEPETPVLPGAPTLPVSTTFEGSMMVQITGIAADATVYYTTDESDPATSDTRVEYTEPFEITATTTVKAVAVNEVGASDPATATYTLVETIVLNNSSVAELIEAHNSGNNIANGATVVGYIVGCVDGTALSNAVFGNDVTTKTNILLADDPYETNVENCIPVQLPSGSVRTELNLADNSDNYQKKVILTGKVVAYFSVAGLKETSAYEFVEELYHTLTVTEAGYATLFLGFNARIPSAIEAYTVTAVNDGWVSLTQVTGVLPSNEGVIIKAPAGDYKFFNEATATADVTGNLLEGSAYNKNIDKEAYVLGNVNGVGLYKAKMTDGTWLNNANKAYLPATSVPNKTIEFYGFDWGGTTGIENIEGDAGNNFGEGAIYDLTGRKINSIAVTGIYIIDGKKVFIRK